MSIVALKALIKTNYYDQAWRDFHSWDHIEKGLECFDRYFSDTVSGLKYAKPIKLAWLLHDAIHIPGYSHNEEASAALVPYYAGLLNLYDLDIKNIQALILQTKKHAPITEDSVPGSDIINDIDLYGMGNEGTYWSNKERIKQEILNFLSPGSELITPKFEDTYDMNRYQFLTFYYDKIPELFKTEIGIELWQPTAKYCMEKEIIDCAELLVSRRLLDTDINALAQSFNSDNKVSIYKEISHEQFLMRFRKHEESITKQEDIFNEQDSWKF